MKLRLKEALLVTSVALLISAPVYAAPINVDPGDEIFTKSLNGTTITCLSHGGQYLPGTPTNGDSQFISAADTTKGKVKKLKKKKKKANEKARKKLSKKIKKLNKTLHDQQAKCNEGPDGTVTPPPPPPGNCESLEKLDRAPTAEDMRYLLEKAAYGAGVKERPIIDIGVAQGIDAAVDALTNEVPEDDTLLSRIENWQDENLGAGSTGAPTFRGGRLAVLDWVINTKNPYRLRLTHSLLGFFTVGGEVLTQQSQFYLWWNYFKMLRAGATTPDLIDLLIKVGKHPLMAIYLDNYQNIAGNPNENYARELMELFSLGPIRLENGQWLTNYTEEINGDRTAGDVNTIARRLTGWRVRQEAGTGLWVEYFSPSQHDAGPETIYPGTAWAFAGEGLEDTTRQIVERHPSAPQYYARELLMEYVNAEPPAALVDAFGQLIKANNFNLEIPMKTLLKSQAFYCAANRNTVTKPAYHVAAEFIKLLELENVINADAEEALVNIEQQISNMGWQVTHPPSVFYYPPKKWIQPTSLLETANFYGQILALANGVQDNSWSPALVLPTGPVRAADVIEFVRNRVGVNLTATQISTLNYFMNFERVNGVENLRGYNNTSVGLQRSKGVPLYLMLAMLADFLLG